MFHWWMGYLAWAALAATGVGTLSAGLAHRGWPYELACHFRLQYALLAGVSVVLFGGAHAWPPATLALGVALVNMRALGLRWVPGLGRRRTPPPSGRTSRVLVSNVWCLNQSSARLERLIHQAAPDVIVLVEMTPRWRAALRHQEATYPFIKVVTRPGGFGIACFSRIPMESAEVVRIGRVGLPSLVMRLRLDGRPLMLVATHPSSPLKFRRWQRRDQQLDAVARFAGQQSGPLLLMGDLNTTPWSPSFQQLLRLSKLRDSRVGYGVQASWPVWGPLLRIPIDHCLVSSGIVVHQRRRGPAIGSDHFPILVEFSVA